MEYQLRYCCQLRPSCCYNNSKTTYTPNTSPTENNQTTTANSRRKIFVKGMRTSLVFLVVTLVSCLLLVSNVVLTIGIVHITAIRQIIHDWVDFLTIMHLLNNTVNPIIYASRFKIQNKNQITFKDVKFVKSYC